MKSLTKPELVALKVREQISSGVYQTGTRLPSERKLAEVFACTQVTVNKAISILASDGMVEKRRGSGNYVCSSEKPATVCFLIEEAGSALNPIWHAAFESFNMAADGSNVTCAPCVVPMKEQDIPFLSLEKADAIVAAIALTKERVQQIISFNKPVIWLEEYSHDLPGTVLTFDNAAAGRLAAEHLLEKGCRSFMYVRYLMRNDDGEDYVPSRLRYEGFCSALLKHKEHCDFISYSFFGDPKEATKRMQRLLAKENGIDGVFCFSDSIVPYVINACGKIDRQIPDDLAVIGVDGSMLSEIFIPSFSSITHPMNEIGKTAFEILQKMLNGESVEKKYMFTPTLIERESTQRENFSSNAKCS